MSEEFEGIVFEECPLGRREIFGGVFPEEPEQTYERFLLGLNDIKNSLKT